MFIYGQDVRGRRVRISLTAKVEADKLVHMRFGKREIHMNRDEFKSCVDAFARAGSNAEAEFEKLAEAKKVCTIRFKSFYDDNEILERQCDKFEVGPEGFKGYLDGILQCNLPMEKFVEIIQKEA